MGASIRFQSIFFQPQQAKHNSQSHSFNQNPDYDLVNYTPNFNGQTSLNETQPPTQTLDWHAPFDLCAPGWDFTCLPDDLEPSIFPSSTDFDLFSRPSDLPTLCVPEKNHMPNSTPIPEPESTPTESRSRSSPADSKSKPSSSTESNARVEKRSANTLAARRYRQKRLDQVAELEAALKETREERDAFRNQVLKLQGETELLKDLLRQKS